METSSNTVKFPLKVEPPDNKSRNMESSSSSNHSSLEGEPTTSEIWCPLKVESTRRKESTEMEENSPALLQSPLNIELLDRERPETLTEGQLESQLSTDRIESQRPGNENVGKGGEKVEFEQINKNVSQRATSIHPSIAHLKPKYMCTVCGSKFTTQRSKNYHFTVRHKEYVQTFPCTFCTEIFSKYYILSKHIEVAHTDFNCALCPYNTHYKHCIRYHVISKHFPELASYKCPVCSKLFHRKADLKVHVRSVHCQIREFICNICHMAFKTKNTLRKHGISMHTDLRPYPCTQCNMTFKKNTNLQMHINSLHSELRPFQCDKCDKSFKHKRNLKGHQAVHSNDQSFQCMICTKLFKTKANLRNHLKYVHDDAAYRFPCKLCGEAFKSKKLLEAHKQAQHSVLTNVACDSN